MTNTLYDMAVGTFIPMLTTLIGVLDKGEEHARGKGQDPEALLGKQLAPDMFTLSKQVQFTCRHAREAAAYLTGKKPAAGEFKEMTLAELKAHIHATIDGVKSADAKAFDGARRIEMPLQPPLYAEMSGFEFLRDWALPNFYFHAVTAYDILRHEGVEIGKRDYMGAALGPHIRQRA